MSVTTKRAPFQRKTRGREHIIGDLAVNLVQRQILLREYTLERIESPGGQTARRREAGPVGALGGGESSPAVS
jgi:hypothetical protein